MNPSAQQNPNGSAGNGSAGASPYHASSYQSRRKPAQGVHIYSGQPTIVFVTVCTKARERWLACEEAHRLLVDIWRQADAWLVGNYVLMPDHLHLFAAPQFDSWGGATGSATGSARLQPSDGSAKPGSAGASPYLAPDQKPYITIERWITFWKGRFSKSHSHAEWVWQAHSFHHRLRRDENYSQKWLYVQENPVRAGLAKDIGQWPYQGIIHELRW